DHVVPAHGLAPLLNALVGTPVEAANALVSEVALETVEEAYNPTDAKRSEQLGEPSAFTCPECQGTLYEIEDGDLVRFRCRVGHGYSSQTMIDAQGESVERALWAALRALEERSALMRRMAALARRRGHNAVADLFDQQRDHVEEDVQAIHAV